MEPYLHSHDACHTEKNEIWWKGEICYYSLPLVSIGKLKQEEGELHYANWFVAVIKLSCLGYIITNISHTPLFRTDRGTRCETITLLTCYTHGMAFSNRGLQLFV